MNEQRNDKSSYRLFGQTLITVVTLVLLQLTPAIAQKADEAREIMRRMIKQASADDEVVDITMKLIDAKGRVRQRTATLYTKKKSAEDDMRLIHFHTPADMAKSGVLTIEHSDRDADQWMYLPAYHTSRRIASTNRSDTYMGTDFAYEDITDPKVEQYQYRILGRERLRDIPCTVIEAIPVDAKLKKESGYSKTIYWVDPEKEVALKIEYYDRSGNLFKRLTNSDLERFGNYYRWQRTEMHDVKRDHRTVVELSNRKINQGLSDQYFSVRYLERGG
jgi:outer membrane lipoprotein-sorting protein